MVLVKNPLKPNHFWLLGIVKEVLSGEDSVVTSAKVKQGGGAIQVHSMKHLFSLKPSLSSDREDQVRAMSLSTGAPAADHTLIPPQTLPSMEGEAVLRSGL